MADEKTMNVDQARKRIGCSRRQVYLLLEDGELKGYRIGKRMGIRIFVESVERFITQRCKRLADE